jgi:hypothetical protein
MEDKSYYKKLFPLLIDYELIQNSETDNFNCISHTLGINTTPSWPTDNDYYWPTKRELTKESFDNFYDHHGFEKLSLLDISYDKRYNKVALYTKDGIPTHASIQIDDIWWESKIGGLGIIKHDLFEIEDDVYGEITQIYRKRLKTNESLITRFKDFIKI